MDSLSVNHPRYSRGLGFMSEAEQQALFGKTVAIAGAGGDGNRYVELARKGINLRVADPETIEHSDMIRVTYATEDSIGRKKVDVFREEAIKRNSGMSVDTYPDGITLDNVEDFLRGADLAIDEIELSRPEIGVAFHRTAREMGIIVLTTMNIGYAGVGTSFHPKGGYTFEKMLGIPDGMPLNEVAETKLDFSRLLPYIPLYGDFEVFKSISRGAKLPSNNEGVDAAAAIGAVQAQLHLTSEVRNRRNKPVWSPNWAYFDSYLLKSGVIRPNRAAFFARLSLVAARSALGINPKASYSVDDIRRREQAYGSDT